MKLYVVKITRVDNPPIVAIFKTAKDVGRALLLHALPLAHHRLFAILHGGKVNGDEHPQKDGLIH